MWSDCFNFINIWKNRVRNFGYKSFAEMEFNMDFLLDIQNKIQEIKNAGIIIKLHENFQPSN